jgi:hypothetical protein
VLLARQRPRHRQNYKATRPIDLGERGFMAPQTLEASWEIIDKEIVDKGMFIMGKTIITIPTSCSRVSFACFW